FRKNSRNSRDHAGQRFDLNVGQSGHADVRLIALCDPFEQLSLRKDFAPRTNPLVSGSDQRCPAFSIERLRCADSLVYSLLDARQRIPSWSRRALHRTLPVFVRDLKIGTTFRLIEKT